MFVLTFDAYRWVRIVQNIVYLVNVLTLVIILRTVFTTTINEIIHRIFYILYTVLNGNNTYLRNPLNLKVLLVNRVGTNVVQHHMVHKFVVLDILDCPYPSNVSTVVGNTVQVDLKDIIGISILERSFLYVEIIVRVKYTNHIVRINIDLIRNSLSFLMFV